MFWGAYCATTQANRRRTDLSLSRSGSLWYRAKCALFVPKWLNEWTKMLRSRKVNAPPRRATREKCISLWRYMRSWAHAPKWNNESTENYFWNFWMCAHTYRQFRRARFAVVGGGGGDGRFFARMLENEINSAVLISAHRRTCGRQTNTSAAIDRATMWMRSLADTSHKHIVLARIRQRTRTAQTRFVPVCLCVRLNASTRTKMPCAIHAHTHTHICL